MEYKRKRLLSFIIVGGYLFLGGCEYAVILPTCLSYLKTLGAIEEYWLGFTISAYSFSAAIAGIIGGRLSDMYEHHTKTITMVSIVIMILGSFQYTLGISVWNVVISRAVCGCGTAAGSAMLAEVCRVTAVEGIFELMDNGSANTQERTPILAICNATRQLGILVGPIFQLLLTYFDFNFGPLQVHPLNAPGIFMAGLWIVFAVMTHFMFYNLSTELKSMKWIQHGNHLLPVAQSPMTVASAESQSHMNRLNSGTTYHSAHSSKSSLQHHLNSPNSACSEDHSPTFPENGVTLGYQLTAQRAVSVCGLDHDSSSSHSHNSHCRRQRKMSYSERFLNSLAQSGQKSNTGHISLLNGSSGILSTARRDYLTEFMTDSFVLMLSMVFTLFYCQVGVETVVPVVMQDYFGFGEFENSLVYMAGGAEALVVFFTVAIISRYVRDTNLLIVGWTILITAHVWLMCFLPKFQADSNGSLTDVALFMIGLVILYFGYAVASVANTGLFSKCLTADTQGLGQGLRRMISYMGLIFGPIWAGATIRKPYLFLGVTLGIIMIHAVMLIFSCGNLRSMEVQSHERDTSPSPNIKCKDNDERKALLG